MQHLPQPLGPPLVVEGGVDGARAGRAPAKCLPEAPLVELMDSVADGLVVAAQGAGDLAGVLPLGVGRKDLAAAEDEGVRRTQTSLWSRARRRSRDARR